MQNEAQEMILEEILFLFLFVCGLFFSVSLMLWFRQKKVCINFLFCPLMGIQTGIRSGGFWLHLYIIHVIHDLTSNCIVDNEWNAELIRKHTGKVAQLMCPDRPHFAIGPDSFWFKACIIMYSAWFQHHNVIPLPSLKAIEPVGHKGKLQNHEFEYVLPPSAVLNRYSSKTLTWLDSLFLKWIMSCVYFYHVCNDRTWVCLLCENCFACSLYKYVKIMETTCEHFH